MSVPDRASQVRQSARRGIPLALAAAALFGLSTPFTKILIGLSRPQLIAGLLYLGSGLGLGSYWLVTRSKRGANETPLTRANLPWLTGAILAGGIAAPLLLMLGLARTRASGASLLLNLEGVFTALLAWFAFREKLRSPYRAWDAGDSRRRRVFVVAGRIPRGWCDGTAVDRSSMFRLGRRQQPHSESLRERSAADNRDKGDGCGRREYIDCTHSGSELA